MALTEFEQMILQQADAIRQRESTVDTEITDEMIELARQGGSEQQVEQLLARKENRSPRHLFPNPVGTFGAAVPPDQVRDAATHVPMVRQPSATDVGLGDEADPTAPVREGDPEIAPYDEWNKEDLQEEAGVRELPKSGNKPDLVARLREDDAQFKAMTSPGTADGDDTPPV